MCDCDVAAGHGWKGWFGLPPQQAWRVESGWRDLSHPLSAGTPRVPSFPPPVFERVRSIPRDLLNVTRMEMIVHIGTHVDSPQHFFVDAPALDGVPMERMSGKGIVWHPDLRGCDLVEPAHLRGLEESIEPGDILLLDTGYHEHVGSAKYDDEHPSLSLAATDWMVEHEIKLIGLDVPTPDLPVTRRGPGFDFPIHRRLLSHGVLIAEHLTNLSSLRGKHVEVVCGALNISGGDGAPARIVAREISIR